MSFGRFSDILLTCTQASSISNLCSISFGGSFLIPLPLADPLDSSSSITDGAGVLGDNALTGHNLSS